MDHPLPPDALLDSLQAVFRVKASHKEGDITVVDECSLEYLTLDPRVGSPTQPKKEADPGHERAH